MRRRRSTPGRGAHLEAQLVDFVDEIAYNNHDIDDGLSSGMITVEKIRGVDLFRESYEEVRAEGIRGERLMRHQTVRRIISRCTKDLVETTLKTVRDANMASVEDVRRAGRRLVGYSPEMARRVKELKEFLFTNLYRHYRVVRMGDKAGRVLRDLFLSYVGEPLQLPPHYQERIPRDDVHRVVCDYIAGMTDRFAVDEHRKLFDPLVRV
jgi:dGTPase